ncbi:MAG: 2-oxo-4-hydroxy-4-carboxy-5-ureidoimidazoline decarboxylase [Rudaea sp.]|uniref:2-oxo-4-hydroxy-4-carboxy-5-ureidoimidazoline decarboxylase n=1 Tax=Rudaea sp. TaxID=2136325 RepID=UPI0039E29121
MDLDTLNRLDAAEFARALGGIYEHSPWIAAAAQARAPFPDADALAAAMREAVASAPREKQLALLRAHPELAGKEAASGTLTAHSSEEQKGAGLVNLSDAEKAELAELNRRYRERFGFPFIVAVRHHTKSSILAELRRRAAGDDAGREFATCLDQVHEIARLRLQALLAG